LSFTNQPFMDFVAIDFETATAQRDSPCEIGLTFVQDYKVVETRSWLIKPKYYPHFDYFNIAVHGIQPQDVAGKPEMPELWEEIFPLLNNQVLIAHNASFDMSVLRKTLETYRLPFPSLHYACSLVFSRNIWTGLPAYDLKSLCNMHGIRFLHHRAASDSRACAELTLRAMELTGATCLQDFPAKFQMNIGQLYEGPYVPCGKKKRK
jgi:DNA polymerase III subunit epsilon